MPDRIRREGARAWRAKWPIYCEIVLFVVLDLLYEILRALVAPDRPGIAAAVRHAHSLVRVERALGIDLESWAQRTTDAMAGGRFITTWYYTLAYMPLFIGFFFVLWFWRKQNYAFVRNWFWTAHAVALVVFWAYPLAPPRLAVTGLVDTTKHALTLGGVLGWFQHLRNEYAAMPSLHIGQSFLYALTLFWLCSSWGRWRNLWWILPVWMAWVTMATANHYLSDGVGGVVAVAASLAIVHWVSAPDIRRPWQERLPAGQVSTLRTNTNRPGGNE
jgi:membrane-associated phospholipid phosphatase